MKRINRKSISKPLSYKEMIGIQGGKGEDKDPYCELSCLKANGVFLVVSVSVCPSTETGMNEHCGVGHSDYKCTAKNGATGCFPS